MKWKRIIGILTVMILITGGFAGAAVADKTSTQKITLSGVNVYIDDTVKEWKFTTNVPNVGFHEWGYTVFCDDYGTVKIGYNVPTGYELVVDTDYNACNVDGGVITIEDIYGGVNIHLSGVEKYHVTMEDYSYGNAPSDLPTIEPEASSVEYYYSFSPSGEGTKWSVSVGNTLDALRETDTPYYMYAIVKDGEKPFETTRTEFRVNKAPGIVLGKVTVDESSLPIVVKLNHADVGRNIEYSLGEGNIWIPLTTEESNSGEFTLPGLDPGKSYTLLIRVVASSNYYSSPVMTQDFRTPDTTPVYMIKYNANGGVGSPADSSVEAGGVLELPDTSGMTRSGYQFAGWWTASEGGNQVKDGTIVTDNMVLYAHWTLIPFPIEFDANGGEGVMSPITVNAGVEVPLPPNTFTKTGNQFVGWATSKTGSVQYKNEASVNLKPDSTGKVTLYAVWIEDKYTVTGNIAGKNGDKFIVSLIYGNITVSQSDWLTIEDGFVNCTFSVPNGVYDVVIEKENGQKVTCIVTVNGKNASFSMKIPDSGVNSEIVVKENAPNTVVGSLDAEAEANREAGKDVTMRLLVESHDEKELAADAATSASSAVEEIRQQEIQEIKTVADDKNDGLDFVSFDVIKETAVEQEVVNEESVLVTSNILEVVMPYDTTGKKDIKVYRKHADSVETLKQMSKKPVIGEYHDGTYYVDYENGNIYIYSQKFSMYAVGYTVGVEAVNPSGIAEKKDSDGETAKSPFPVLGIFAGLGIVSILVMRRK